MPWSLDEIWSRELFAVYTEIKSARSRRVGDVSITYLLLQLSVLLLSVDEIEDDVECAGKNERKEQAKASEICVPLCTLRVALLA